MATYRNVEQSLEANEAQQLVQTLLKTTFKELRAAGVTVSVLAAYAPQDKYGRPKGPALKHRGRPAAATIEINSARDRTDGKADCTLTIDGDKWDSYPDRRKEALIHHELTHLVVDDGKEDAAGRPKLLMRQHDIEIGIFKDTINAYGTDAIDYDHVKGVADYVQGELFPRG